VRGWRLLALQTHYRKQLEMGDKELSDAMGSRAAEPPGGQAAGMRWGAGRELASGYLNI